MSLAVSAKGIRLYVKATGDTWTEVKEVSAVPEIGQSAEKIDVTHLTSEMKEYIKDIPDWSADLEFTMNAMPKGATNSNLDLILGLDKDETYDWKIVYAQLLKEVTVKAQFNYRFGAGAVSSKQDFILTLVPTSALSIADYDASQQINYVDGNDTQEEGA